MDQFSFLAKNTKNKTGIGCRTKVLLRLVDIKVNFPDCIAALHIAVYIFIITDTHVNFSNLRTRTKSQNAPSCTGCSGCSGVNGIKI